MKSFHLLILLTLVAACATHDASTEWDLVDDSPDPLDHEESDDDDSPDDIDLSDDLDDATDDDEPVARTCSELDLDNWDPDDFAFELFHYFSCRRPADENLVFSPTLARLTLIELAEERGGTEGDEIAAILGFSDLQEAMNSAAALQDELLSRRPVGTTGYVEPMMVEQSEYFIDEQDPDRLLEALGVEFFESRCADGSCSYQARNDRWPDNPLSEITPEPEVHSRGFALRGQWEYEHGSGVPRTREFEVADRSLVTFYPQVRAARYQEIGPINLIEFRLVGGELSLFLVDSSDSPQVLATTLTHTIFRHWIDRITESTRRASVRYPPFDITDRLDITSPLRFSPRAETSARAEVDYRGITSPNPVSIHYERTQNTVKPEVYPGSTYFVFDEPFIFFVYDYPTESILLIGRVSHPISADDWKAAGHNVTLPITR